MIYACIVSIYLQSISADIDSIEYPLGRPQLPFESEEYAKSWALRSCRALYDYMSDESKAKYPDGIVAFEKIYGSPGNSLDAESRDEVDGRSVFGYYGIRTKLAITRRLLSVSNPEHCLKDLQLINYGDYFIEYSYNTESGLGSFRKKLRSFTIKIIYNPKRGTTQRVIVSSNGEKFAGSLFDAAVSASTTAVNAAAYLGIIEEQIEGTNENIKIITQTLTYIFILIGALFALSIALCINVAFNRFRNMKKYKTVSMSMTSEDEEE